MAYAVGVTQGVRDRDLPALDPADQARVRARMATLSLQPNRHPPLSGPLAGLRSVRAGQVRVIFAVDDERPTVTVVAVGRRHARERRDVYAETSRRLQRGGPDAAPASQDPE